MPDLKIFTDNIEQTALDQIHTLLAQKPFRDCKIRIMPDVHAGAGCVIGFTADLGDKVIPNIVGVDIGCGMRVVSLGKAAVDFEKLDRLIRRKIPSGRDVHSDPVRDFDLDPLFCRAALKSPSRLVNSVGTLGGGNHFIEIDKDEAGNSYLVIHTGSRNLGKQVADLYQRLAIETLKGDHTDKKEAIAALVEQYKAAGQERKIAGALRRLKKEIKPAADIPNELCYLEGEDREHYLHDMKLCQEFAVLNRTAIAEIILEGMAWEPGETFESIHNYIDHRNNIVRKGAIAAYQGQKVLIPLNMRDGCIIGIGKGNEDWNCSAPHGAGRVLSRSKAKETISMEAYKASMAGIFTTSVNPDTLDESPMAYKPSEEIIRLVRDTVEIERIIKPVYNFKAVE